VYWPSNIFSRWLTNKKIRTVADSGNSFSALVKENVKKKKKEEEEEENKKDEEVQDGEIEE